MAKRPTIYELLATQQASATTISQLNSATKSSYIDDSNIEFWSGMITVARALDASRTNAHGIVIPETGVVHIETIANGANSTITPTGSEVWYVQNLDVDQCTAAFKDSDGNISPLDLGGGNSKLAPFYLSAKMSIVLFNGSGSEQTPSIAYFKVSL